MILKGKRGIISGALDESSIAWKVAERCHDEGAEFTLTNAPMAMRMGKINELGEKCNAEVIGADLTSIEEIENLYEKSLSKMNGKIDFIPIKNGAKIKITFLKIESISGPIISKNTSGKINNDKMEHRNAIFIIPSLEIVGSTKNQWPIIIDDKTPLVREIGRT